MKKLDASGLSALSASCSKLYSLGDTDTLWRALYVRDFTTMTESESSWRQLYMKAKRERKIRAREAMRPSRSDPTLPYRIPGHMGPPIPNPDGMIPGMIGGEYDLRPGGAFPGNPLIINPPIR